MTGVDKFYYKWIEFIRKVLSVDSCKLSDNILGLSYAVLQPWQ